MPRYFFNVQDDLDLSDDEGIDLPDLDAALSVAVRYAGAVLRESDGRLRLGDAWSLEVSDALANAVFRIDLQIRPAQEERAARPCRSAA